MRELPGRRQLDRYRSEAKTLVRAVRAGEAWAIERATAVLGGRGDRPFLLADAQFVVARRHGHRSWAALRRQLLPLAALAAEARGDVVVDSGLAYGDGEPVEILVRKREHRYLLSDRGRAIAKAERRPAGERPRSGPSSR